MKKSFLLLDQHFNVTVLYLLFTITSLQSHVTAEVSSLRFEKIPPNIKIFVEKIDKLGKHEQGAHEMKSINIKLVKPEALANTLEIIAKKIKNTKLQSEIEILKTNTESLVCTSEDEKNNGNAQIFSFFSNDNDNGENEDSSFGFIGVVAKKYLHKEKGEVVDYYIAYYDYEARGSKTTLHYLKVGLITILGIGGGIAIAATGGAAAVGAAVGTMAVLANSGKTLLKETSYGDYNHQKELQTNLRDFVVASFIHRMMELGIITVKSDDKISLN